MEAILQTFLPELPLPRRGKVREIYDLCDRVLIVATDRISAFDVVMGNGIPDKGKVLNQLSAFWFDRLSAICPHHMITIDDSAICASLPAYHQDLAARSMIARKATPLPIECVARGYISGSLYKDYKREGSNVHGISLPEGLVDGDRLPKPIFTPATKESEGHDRNITFQEAADLVGVEVAEQVMQWTLALYQAAQQHAESVGLILADTKFEFGIAEEGLLWIDEALTPDSSRYWDASHYSPGIGLPSYDKQFVRDFLESINWDKLPPGPELPQAIVTKTRDKYFEAFRRLTGRELQV